MADALINDGKLVATTRANIARSGVGVAVKKGAPKPDISTTEAFKRTLLAAKSIGYVEVGASGIYLKGLFERMGIAEQIKPKIKLLPPSNPAAQAVANLKAPRPITVGQAAALKGFKHIQDQLQKARDDATAKQAGQPQKTLADAAKSKADDKDVLAGTTIVAPKPALSPAAQAARWKQVSFSWKRRHRAWRLLRDPSSMDDECELAKHTGYFAG